MKHFLPEHIKVIHWSMLKHFESLFGKSSPGVNRQQSAIRENRFAVVYEGLFGEERPRPMLVWLTVLVTLLHILLAKQLFSPVEPLTQATPLPMEVMLVAAAGPQQADTVIKPVELPKPQPPEKKQVQSVKKKPKPVMKKPLLTAKKLPTKPIKTAEPEPKESFAVTEAPPAPAPVQPAAPKLATAPNKAEVFTEANFQANYGYNPKPVYPSIARRQHWEGKVILRVQVSADGTSGAISVQHSSGYEELDESAVEAVKRWRFIPAKRGSTPVSSSVLVPIIFNLQH